MKSSTINKVPTRTLQYIEKLKLVSASSHIVQADRTCSLMKNFKRECL